MPETGRRDPLRDELRRRQAAWRGRRRQAARQRGVLLLRLRALGDERRLLLLEMLREGERCICELQEFLPLSQPLLSHHLRVLKQAGLVVSRRDGRWAHYKLAPEAFAEVRDQLAALQQPSGS